MHHYTWQWSPTVLALVILLGTFLVLSLLLLILPALFFNRRKQQAGRRLRVPDGQLGYRDIELQRMSKRGIERARSRQYHIKGRE